MPQATDIVVKNGASPLVDKTFSLVTPASGDGGIAHWALKEGSISAVFPTLTASAAKNGNRARKLKLVITLPSSYADAVTGLTNVGSSAQANVSVTIPDTFPEDQKANFVAFVANIMGHSLIKAMVRDAYPAT